MTKDVVAFLIEVIQLLHLDVTKKEHFILKAGHSHILGLDHSLLVGLVHGALQMVEMRSTSIVLIMMMGIGTVVIAMIITTIVMTRIMMNDQIKDMTVSSPMVFIMTIFIAPGTSV